MNRTMYVRTLGALVGISILCSPVTQAQQAGDGARLVGKICLGTWTTNPKGYPQPLDMGALRITFGPSLPLTGIAESAPGEVAFRAPHQVNSFRATGSLANIVVTSTKLSFKSGSGNQYDLSGSGLEFTGTLDPRPTYPNVANVVLRCK